MKKYIVINVLALLLTATWAQAQTPSIAPTATFTDADGNESEESTFSGSAPITATFKANPSDVGSYVPHYEWRFYTQGMEDEPYLIRYEEETNYTFTSAGTSYIVCYATFINGNDTVAYTTEYWGNEMMPFQVSVYESKLEFPNAFTPNGDGVNDIYKAKSGYQSIVEFKATIYNRWGHKIYEWSDPAGGWDGNYRGKPAKQGVYFVLVKAKGADGRKFNIRRDVNLLRDYTLTTN